MFSLSLYLKGFRDNLRLRVADRVQIHFKFSTETGMKIGEQVALDTLADFDALWKNF